MKEQLKHILRKWSALYWFVETSFHTLRLRHLKECLLGTGVREREWATRHLRKERKRDDWGTGSGDWIKSYRNSTDHPHRQILIDIISQYNPSNILEIGCNCGPNLYPLVKKFPDAKIIGIDINPLAVQKGNEWLAQEGISNVKLLEGKADELGQFQDKSFDVVFTDAVLIYIGPDKIREVMMGLIRIAHHALILTEWHSFEPEKKDPYGLGVYYNGCWKRDYVALLKQFVREEQIRVTKITGDVWPDKNWKRWGGIIEVTININNSK